MIRFKFSTVIGLLLLPATVCGTLSSDLEEIYKSIQKRICKPLNSSEDFQTYINLFDEYWNLTDALDAMAKVKQNYQGELKENCTIDGYQLIPDYFYGNSGYR